MDFFEHQAQAKAASQRLLLLFLVLCFAFVVLMNGVIYGIYVLDQGKRGVVSEALTFASFYDWQLSYAGFITSLVSIAFIGFGCLLRWFELRKGGNGLAISMGARSLGFASKDEREQKLINVVEEMAIASGVTTPSVYILEHETSINAFVAGYSMEDTALVVTQGLLNSMDRDELQAVVGHEFSHILHGDNQINIRLMVLIAGFVWVAEFGRMLIFDRHHHSRRQSIWTARSRDHRGGGFILGIPIMMLGYVGVFFGRLIRMAVSRKREYLADASSVQFTRNPMALASALNVIRENTFQGALKHARSEEISHMCIAPARKASWFDTHPPLEDRINAIDDTFLLRNEVRQRKQEREDKRQEQTSQAKQVTSSIYGMGVSRLQTDANSHLSEMVGTVNSASLDYAMSLHDEIPYEFRQALYDSFKASICLLYILLDKDVNTKKAQVEFIQKQYPESKDIINTLDLLSQDMPKRLRLPLVELMVPLLKTMKEEEKTKLLGVILKISKWDQKLTMFEISLYTLLKDAFESKENIRSTYSIKKVSIVAYELNVIVCSLIHHAGGNEEEKQALHQRMLNVLSVKDMAWLSKEKIPAKDVYVTLKKLKSLAPMLKRTLMDVCGDIVLHDGIVHHSEYETLRLMSLVMACPMPLLPKAA